MYILAYTLYASIHLLFRASSWIQQDECHCTFEYFEAPNGQEKQPASFTKARFYFSEATSILIQRPPRMKHLVNWPWRLSKIRTMRRGNCASNS